MVIAQNISDEFGMLKQLLELPPIDYFINMIKDHNLVQFWFKEYKTKKSNLHYLSPGIPFKLIQLEYEFQNLLTSYNEKKCFKCNTVPKKPALCLFCGSLVCFNSTCCDQSVLNHPFIISEAEQHMKSCSAVGIYLLLKKCLIVLVGYKQGKLIYGTFSSIYLDKYGEEDLEFRRGKSLFLDQSRYEHLHTVWLTNTIYEEIKKNNLYNISFL